jgi:hypothetical protein
MRIINLCSFPIKVERFPGSGDDSIIIFKSNAAEYNVNFSLARQHGNPEYIDNIVVNPIYVGFTETTSGIPDPQEGVMYLVPKEIANFYISSERGDILYPDFPDSKPNIANGEIPTYRGLYQYRS